MAAPRKIMMVAGEHSGDILGAGLIKSLKQHYPDAIFSGIGGERMMKEGFRSLYPMSKLSVFGLFEVIKHLPELLNIRRNLKQYILDQKPDVFIGIDAPDFNLALEKNLHQQGLKTVHYVSPTVWAWRPKRIKKLQGTLNALLCIFPFEEAYFKNKSVPAAYIGHPLADKYQQAIDLVVARSQLDLSSETPVLTLMPGSRMGEIGRHGLLFLKTAVLCAELIPNLKILVPMADEAGKELLTQIIADSDIKLNISITVGPPELLISAANIVLTASGTATLEIMLLKRPMVVAYQLSAATAWVIRTFSLLNIAFVSMPNLIAGKEIVPEFIQEAAQPDVMAEQLLRLYYQPDKAQTMINEFNKMKIKLTRDANKQAALVVSNVIEGKVIGND